MNDDDLRTPTERMQMMPPPRIAEITTQVYDRGTQQKSRLISSKGICIARPKSCGSTFSQGHTDSISKHECDLSGYQHGPQHTCGCGLQWIGPNGMREEDDQAI